MPTRPRSIATGTRCWKAGVPISACGWLKDRYGLAWQVVPRRLIELISGPDRAAAERAMQAMMEMVKLDIAEIERAPRAPDRRTAPPRFRRPEPKPKGRPDAQDDLREPAG